MESLHNVSMLTSEKNVNINVNIKCKHSHLLENVNILNLM
jgi:hypothetical protein